MERTPRRPRPLARQRVGDAGRSAARACDRDRRGVRTRRRHAPRTAAARRRIPPPGRFAGDPDLRARADLRPGVRLRHRAEARARRPDLVLPDRRRPARRAAIGRHRPAEADAEPRGGPGVPADARRAARGVAGILQRIADRRIRRGDRRRLRRAGRGRRRTRPPDIPGEQPARDAARVRRRRDPDRHGRRPVRARVAGRARGRSLEDEDLTRLLTAFAVIAALTAGCGEKEESLEPGAPEPLEIMLDFFPNADHAPIYAAESGGHFEEVGLDVEIREPPDPAAPLKQVVAGRVDLAISYEPEVLRARDDGLAVHAVGALVQSPLTSIISLPPAGIRKPEDLDGKVVGTAGIDYQTAYLDAIAKRAGADVEERNVGFNLTGALLAKKVDAILGGFWNYEGTDLRIRGRNPQIIRLEQAGVPTYDELVLVANSDQEDDRIKRFAAAVERGVQDLRRDPDRALKGLLDANPDLDPELQRAVLQTTLPLFSPPSGKPFGWQEP